MQFLSTLLFKLLLFISFFSITTPYNLSSRYEKLQNREPRKLESKERKLGITDIIGTLGSGAAAGIAANTLLGPSADDKRKLETLRSDIDREKQQYMMVLMSRSTVISDIDAMISKSEEKLQELASTTVGRIYSLNSMIENANMKQIKAIKKYLKIESS